MIKRLHQIENLVLATWALLLVLLAALQIAARWHVVAQFLPDGGLPGVDAVLKISVLWLAMLGALAAARDEKHLGMDALVHALPGNGQRIARALAFGFAALICAYVSYYGYQFVRLEYESPSEAHGLVPTWLVACIFPFAFAGMAVRFLIHTINSARALRPAP